MTYLQQTVVADAPATKETMAAAHGLSSSCFCAAVAETVAAGEDAAVAAATAAASSGSCSFCAAAAVETASDSVASADPALSFRPNRGCRDIVPGIPF